MARQGHFVKPTKGDMVPRRFVILDCERTLEQHENSPNAYNVVLNGGIAHSFCWHKGKLLNLSACRFKDTQTFWNWLATQISVRFQTWIFANSMYEQSAALGLYRLIANREVAISDNSISESDEVATDTGWKGCCITSDPPTIVVCRRQPSGETMRWLDVRNYGVDTSDFDDSPGRNVARIVSWLEAYLATITRHGLGSMQSTISSQAMSGWRRGWCSEKVHIHDHEKAIKLERDSIFGGRCECPFLGTVRKRNFLYGDDGPVLVNNRVIDIDGPVYHLDINSAYPAAGCSSLIPIMLATYAENVRLGLATELLEGKVGIAEVAIDTKHVTFPFRNPDNGLLIYPLGRYVTVLADPELTIALDAGLVKEVRRMATYVCGSPFKDFYKEMYELRRRYRFEGLPEMASCLKSLLVGLHGKFAQKPKDWVSVPDYKTAIPFGSWWGKSPGKEEITRWRSIGWQVEYLAEGEEGENTFPAISSVIQSIVRVELGGAIELIGKERIFYYDTDSVWTDRVGYEKMQRAGHISETDMGKWKVSGMYNSVEFKGVKNYVADGEVTCAGLRRPTLVPSIRDPAELTQIELESMYRSGHTPQGLLVVQKASYAGGYRHGKVHENGFVTPFQLKEF